jgi:hypothetical protein
MAGNSFVQIHILEKILHEDHVLYAFYYLYRICMQQ